MRIRVTSVYVDNQEKALRFYTRVLGLVKKTDLTNADRLDGPYRWLTVASPEEPDGVELQLAPNADPAAKAYQQAMFLQGERAVRYFVDDLQAEYERMKSLGARFTLPPTKVPGSSIATVDDTCGNLFQLTELDA